MVLQWKETTMALSNGAIPMTSHIIIIIIIIIVSRDTNALITDHSFLLNDKDRK